jgi:DNA-directed RNA polymerase I, II, and III subunit RPABC2
LSEGFLKLSDIEKSDKTISKEKRVLIGPPILTRFEKARIVGARALQIAMGAPLLVEPSEGVFNPIDLALFELERNVLPISIRRTLPDGTYQNIPLKWLLEKKS